MEQTIRIDKWLWAVRMFKTRSLASDACRAGKVRVKDQPVKPSRDLHTGEEVSVSYPPIVRIVRVIALTHNRVSAKLVSGFYEDLTPESEYEKLRMKREVDFEFRPPGLGRPTKRERREIEYLKYYFDE